MNTLTCCLTLVRDVKLPLRDVELMPVIRRNLGQDLLYGCDVFNDSLSHKLSPPKHTL